MRFQTALIALRLVIGSRLAGAVRDRRSALLFKALSRRAHFAASARTRVAVAARAGVSFRETA
jgi:hypothetical protein